MSSLNDVIVSCWAIFGCCTYVPLHSPAFLFERTSCDAAGRTLEFVHSLYRGDRYRIVTELTTS